MHIVLLKWAFASQHHRCLSLNEIVEFPTDFDTIFTIKIIFKDGLNNLDNSQFGLGLLKYNSGLRANIDYPNVKYSPNSLPKFNIDPNINIGFLNDNFLKSHVFSSSVCPVK